MTNIEVSPIIELSKVSDFDSLGKFSTIHTSHIVAVSSPKCIKSDIEGRHQAYFWLRTADNNQYTISFRTVPSELKESAQEALNRVHIGLNKMLSKRTGCFIALRSGKLCG